MHSKKRRNWGFQGVVSTISTMMVLVLLGLVTLGALTAREVATHVRENLIVTVVLQDTIASTEASLLQGALQEKCYVGDIEYISSEQARAEQAESMGFDPVELLDFNPYPISMELHICADYASSDSLAWIAEELRAMPQVDEVAYPRDVVDNLNRNIQRVSIVLLGIAALLILISVCLIVNLVRLNIFSHRFSIRTMKLVGAKWSFIRRPFIWRSIVIALCAILLALGILYACVQGLCTFDEALTRYITMHNMLFTAGVVSACGLTITVLSTYVCVTYYLYTRGTTAR